MDKPLNSLGLKLRTARKARFPKDTQSDFALRAGVSRATYQKMEKGDLSVAIGSYFNAAKILKLEKGFSALFDMPLSLFDE
jgi:DNA-binding XRE family transcriptional regulator